MLDSLEYWQLAAILKPFILLFMAVFVLYPARVLVERKMKPGKIKTLLLRRVN